MTHDFTRPTLPTTTPAMLSNFLTACSLLLAASPFPEAFQAEAPRPIEVRRGTMLSEDPDVAGALERSLNGFLSELRQGECSDRYVSESDRRRFSFFYEGLVGLAADPELPGPLVLKSSLVDGEVYFVTVAFERRRNGETRLHKIVEFRADPAEDGYRFSCPFEARTKAYRSTPVGSVTFHHRSELDLEQAGAFTAFKIEFEALTGVPEAPLDYYVFDRLDDLLTAYGFVYDSTKCNFLAHDLGFSDDAGRRFVTGTGNPNYVAEFVGEHLRTRLPNQGELYSPFVQGMSTAYGGYFLSGDTVEDLKDPFREKLRAEPDVDFLEEFRKGRGSSVHRHFSYYVLCAFLCEEALHRRGFEQALELAYTGAEGERFFEVLESTLGIEEAGFHDAIVRLLTL